MEKKLFRSKKNKKLTGVCSGLGQYFGIDPKWIRLGFVVLTLAEGVGAVVYLAASLLIPEAEDDDEPAQEQEHQQKAQPVHAPHSYDTERPFDTQPPRTGSYSHASAYAEPIHQTYQEPETQTYTYTQTDAQGRAYTYTRTETAQPSGYEREKREAIEAGHRALQSLRLAQSDLESARNWGVADMFMSRSMLVSMAKHSKMSNARHHMEQARYDLQSFSRELGDISMTLGMNLDTDGFLSFADVFFDNILVDWMVQDRINQTRNQVSEAIRRVEQILNQLER